MSCQCGPYADKTAAEIVHDYAVTRGDLSEQYARDQLARIIDCRAAHALDEAACAIEEWERLSAARATDSSRDPRDRSKALQRRNGYCRSARIVRRLIAEIGHV